MSPADHRRVGRDAVNARGVAVGSKTVRGPLTGYAVWASGGADLINMDLADGGTVVGDGVGPGMNFLRNGQKECSAEQAKEGTKYLASHAKRPKIT